MPRASADRQNGEGLLRLRVLLLTETDENHPISSSKIIDMMTREGYSISQRTIKKYAGILNTDDIGDRLMIESRRIGKEMCYWAEEREFEPAEVNILCDAVINSHFITESKTEDLLEKLKKLVSRPESQDLHTMSDFDKNMKVNNHSSYNVLNALWEAIRTDRAVTFRYMTWNTKKQLVDRYKDRETGKCKVYEASPWGVFFQDNEYYVMLYRHDKQTRAIFRVDKMKDVSLLDVSRLGRESVEGVDFDTYSSRTFGMFDSEQKGVEIVCPFYKCGIFIDRFGKDIQILDIGDKKVKIHFQVSANALFFGWIMGLGNDVKIAGPDGVVQQYRELLQETLQRESEQA